MKEPKNYLVNLRYAEILYSVQSNKDRLADLTNARKYFSHAAVLKQGEEMPRILFGLLKCCQAIEKLSKKEDEKNTEMINVAKKRIKEMYSKTSKLSAVS